MCVTVTSIPIGSLGICGYFVLDSFSKYCVQMLLMRFLSLQCYFAVSHLLTSSLWRCRVSWHISLLIFATISFDFNRIFHLGLVKYFWWAISCSKNVDFKHLGWLCYFSWSWSTLSCTMWWGFGCVATETCSLPKDFWRKLLLCVSCIDKDRYGEMWSIWSVNTAADGWIPPSCVTRSDEQCAVFCNAPFTTQEHQFWMAFLMSFTITSLALSLSVCLFLCVRVCVLVILKWLKECSNVRNVDRKKALSLDVSSVKYSRASCLAL